MQLLFRKHFGGWAKRLWEGGPYDEVMLQYDQRYYLLKADDGRIDLRPRVVFADEWDALGVKDLDRDTVWQATLYETGTDNNLSAILAQLLGVKLFWKDPNALYKALTK